MATTWVNLPGPNGNTPTTTELNPGGISSVIISSDTGTYVYDNTAGAHDDFGIAFSGRRTIEWRIDSTTTHNKCSLSTIIKLPSTWPTSSVPIAQFVNNSGGVADLYTSATTSGRIIMRIGTGTFYEVATGLTLGAKYRFTMTMDAADLTAGSGKYAVKCYSDAGGGAFTSLVSSYAITAGTFAGKMQGFKLGPNSASVGVNIAYTDIQFEIDSDVEIGDLSTAYTASPADSAGITDSVSAVMTFIRDIADSVGITDTPGPQVMSIEISQDDTAGATDAVAAVASVVRSVADAVGATDAATTITSMVRVLGDPAAITDTAAAILNATRHVDDAAGATDAASVVVSAARTVADVAGITDSVTATIYLGADVNDTAGATDAVEVTIAAYRSPAEAIAASDTVATILSAQRQTDDQAGITDAATAALAAVRQVDDNAGITDDASVLMVSVRTISDGAAVTDTVIAVLGSDIPAEGGDVWAPRPPIRLVSPGAPIRTYAPRRRA